MYKVDEKYMKSGRVQGFDYEDFSQNPTKFCNLESLYGDILWVGLVPDHETDSKNYYTTHSHSIFNKDGVELCCLDEHRFLTYQQLQNSEQERVDRAYRSMINASDEVKASQTKAYQQALMEQKLTLLYPIIEESCKNPEVIEHIPLEFYLDIPTLGEEILTDFQKTKMAELRKFPEHQDCSAFVEEIKTTVAGMNKALNNIKKEELQENFADLFQRDKTL